MHAHDVTYRASANADGRYKLGLLLIKINVAFDHAGTLRRSLVYRAARRGAKGGSASAIAYLGRIDRALRILAGLLLLASPLAWYGPENISPWGYIGLIPFLSGLTGHCPLYAKLGRSTARA